MFFFAQRIFFESRFSSLSKKFCFHRPLLVNQGLLLSSKALCLNQSFLVDQHVLLIIYLLQITVSVWINATSSSFLKVFVLINVFFLNLVYSHSPWGTPGVLGIGNRHWLQIGAPVSRRARQKFVFGKVSAGGNSSSVGNSSAGKVSPCNINSSLKWYSAAQAKRATLNADIMQLSPELMPRLFLLFATRKKHESLRDLTLNSFFKHSPSKTRYPAKFPQGYVDGDKIVICFSASVCQNSEASKSNEHRKNDPSE